MPDEFKLTQHPAVASTEWDFGKMKPDVLIVALGTNDFADYPPGSCATPDAEGFQAAYKGFLDFARSRYEKAEIFAVGTFLAIPSNQFSTCNKAICGAVIQMHDPHVHCIDPSMGAEGMWLTGPEDYIGDWTHPTIPGHTKIATHLRDVIKPIMGW